jgi:hypothetical protein
MDRLIAQRRFMALLALFGMLHGDFRGRTTAYGPPRRSAPRNKRMAPGNSRSVVAWCRAGGLAAPGRARHRRIVHGRRGEGLPVPGGAHRPGALAGHWALTIAGLAARRPPAARLRFRSSR